MGLIMSAFTGGAGAALSGKGALAQSGTGLGVGTSSFSGNLTNATVGSPLSGMGSLKGLGGFSGFQGGFANGGSVMSGKPALVGERGPELFVPGRSGSIVPNSAMGGVQVGSINITVQNTGEQLSPAAQKQIANQVQGIVMSTLVNERRSGGVLR